MATISNAKDKRNDKEYSIQEIRKIKEDKLDVFDEVKSNLVCYDCEIPQMVPRLGEITEDHFAKAPKQNHHFDCYYFGEEYTQKEVDKIVSNIENDKPSQSHVENAFNQIQRYLTRDEADLETIVYSGFGNRNKNNQSQSQSGDVNDESKRASNSKYIPRKKLTKEVSDEDIGIWKIYYGRVGIKHTGSNDNYENYIVYACIGKETMPYRISIGISKKVHPNFNDQTKRLLKLIAEKKLMVNLMILGKVSRHNTYSNIAVYDTRLLSISS